MRARLVTGSANPRATTEFDAATGTLPAGSTFTRASTATRLDYRGYLVERAVDSPRFTYDPALTYNESMNPWGGGAGFPDDWAQIAGGLTATVTNRTTNGDGTTTVEFTISGTSNGNAQVLFASSNTGLPINILAAPGESFAFEMGIEVVSLTGATARCWLSSLNSSGATINSNALQSAVIPPGTPPQLYRLSGALVNAGTVGAGGGLRIDGVNNGVPVSGLVRLTFPVLSRGLVHLTDSVPLSTLSARIGTTPQYGLLGLLLEEASTNLVTYSQDFSQATEWTFGAITPTYGAVSAAGYTAARLDEGTTSAQHVVNGAVNKSVTIGLSYCASIVVRPETCERIVVSFSNAGFGSSHFAAFDLIAGTAFQVGALAVASITPVGGGFFRCSIVCAATATATAAIFFTMAENANPSPGRAPSFLGTSRTLLLAASQLEEGAFPTSYIVTGAATATRARDHLSIPSNLLGNGPAAWSMRMTQGPGTSGVNTRYFMAIDLGANGPRLYTNTSNSTRVTLRSGNVDQMFNPQGVVSPGVFRTHCLTWGGGTGDFATNGDAPVNDAAVTNPASYAGAPISLPDSPASALGCPMILRFLRFWKVRLTPSQVRRESLRTA